jgi:hypothetical protein
MENKFFNTKLKDVHGNRMNIGSSVRINHWDHGKLVFENGKYYIKIKTRLTLVTPKFIKERQVEVISKLRRHVK